MPQWEHINTRFDIDYTDLKKSESTNILTIEVREHLINEHLINNYQNHIKIFTDGSVLAEWGWGWGDARGWGVGVAQWLEHRTRDA